MTGVPRVPRVPRVTLRRAVVDDAEALVVLHHACWVEAYTDLLGADVVAAVFADPATLVARRRQRATDGTDTTWLAEHDGELAGFASVGPGRRDDAPTDVELYALYTRASRWGDGTGGLLMRAAVGDDPAHLWVLAGNARATAFYRRRGFTPDGASYVLHDRTHVRLVRTDLPPSGP